MEGLTRLVTESLARHGFDRPLDYRRLHWSRWFRCESPHSLLFVPSKPGVFALAEEVMDLGAGEKWKEGGRWKEGERWKEKDHVGTAAPGCPAEQSSAAPVAWDRVGACPEQNRGNPVRPSAARRDFAGTTIADSPPSSSLSKRMLAVTQFFEDDDMAFVLDRMFSRENPMRARLASGRYFVRFVVIQDQGQRRSICSALNQWIVSSSEKASGIGAHFATSLELTPATEYVPQSNEGQGNLFKNATNDGSDDTPVATAASAVPPARSAAELGVRLVSTAAQSTATAPRLDSGAATNIHCPSPLPSGF